MTGSLPAAAMDRRPSETRSFERVGGPGGPFFLGDGQHLVGQVGLAQVVERLAGHGRVGDLRLVGAPSDRAASASVDLPADDDDWMTAPRGRSESRAGERQPGHQGAVPFAHDAERPEGVPPDPSGRPSRAAPGRASRSAALMAGHRRRWASASGRLGVLGGQQHLAEFASELLGVGVQLSGRALRESGTGLGRVEVQGVDVEPLSRGPPSRSPAALRVRWTWGCGAPASDVLPARPPARRG